VYNITNQIKSIQFVNQSTNHTINQFIYPSITGKTRSSAKA